MGETPWYKNAVIYQVHVRAFHDSNDDGIGDFPGLTQRLDYIQDLGVTAIWLLPFYPSPLRDDGYDIADYTGVNPMYGSLRDFRRFVSEAHKRDLRVITELVLNHTSDQHEWFQRARRAPRGSAAREFYVWSDSPKKYADARIIFKDFESSNWTWDAVAGQYYWHRFYSHQPDLNFENPAVHEALLKMVDHWFGLGVDGLRLDAVPYLYEAEGTSCENLPQTHEFLKKLRAHVDARFKDRMLLAEANQWPEDAVAYFGRSDECHMAFHFPLMPRMFMGLRLEDRFPIIDIMQQTPSLPQTCQWAVFLRNHDELTLEMVTDEERDYMYRVFATDRQARINLGIRRRLAPLMDNNRRKIEFINALLFSLPGTPVVYYGDEIGMGDNIYLRDRDSVRTPMQWSPDRNAGFSRANSQRLFLPVIVDPEFSYEAINVQAQNANVQSLLWWMKRLIALRRRHEVFGDGELEFLTPENSKVLVFIRRNAREQVLVVANLSRFAQCVELNMPNHRGFTPVELFGGTRFPPIGELPYFLTLGPHGFYWFALEPQRVEERAVDDAPAETPVIAVRGDWERLFDSTRNRQALESLVLQNLGRQRWFASKARTIRGCSIVEAAPAPLDEPASSLLAFLVLAEVTFREGEPEMYAIPLAAGSMDRVERLFGPQPPNALGQLRRSGGDETRWLYDAMHDPAFRAALLTMIRNRRRVKGVRGEFRAVREPALMRRLRTLDGESIHSTLSRAEQSNTSVLYDEAFILKLIRKSEPGMNPDLEIGRLLTEQARFAHTPPLAGSIEYAPSRGEPHTLAILQTFVANEGDGWAHATSAVEQFFERVATTPTNGDPEVFEPVRRPIVELLDERPSESILQMIGPFLQSAELIGARTAQMHLALANSSGHPDFAPEPFTPMYQRSLYQSMRNMTRRTLSLLQQNMKRVDPAVAGPAQTLISSESAILDRYRAITEQRVSAMRIRVHGDYHLGQLLFTGKDFTIIDFEGEPARPISVRRIKRSPLRDVAGMLRSFAYASRAVLIEQRHRGVVTSAAEQAHAFEAWARLWSTWCGVVFLRQYLAEANGAPFLPEGRDELGAMLQAYVLEKTLYELGYELNSRPTWLSIPLGDLIDLLALPAAPLVKEVT